MSNLKKLEFLTYLRFNSSNNREIQPNTDANGENYALSNSSILQENHESSRNLNMDLQASLSEIEISQDNDASKVVQEINSDSTEISNDLSESEAHPLLHSFNISNSIGDSTFDLER